MQYTEIDYIRSAGIVIFGATAIVMAMLVLGRWLYRRRVQRSHDQMTKEYGSDWEQPKRFR